MQSTGPLLLFPPTLFFMLCLCDIFLWLDWDYAFWPERCLEDVASHLQAQGIFLSFIGAVRFDYLVKGQCVARFGLYNTIFSSFAVNRHLRIRLCKYLAPYQKFSLNLVSIVHSSLFIACLAFTIMTARMMIFPLWHFLHLHHLVIGFPVPTSLSPYFLPVSFLFFFTNFSF